MSKTKPARDPDRPPSADTLIELEKLLAGALTSEKIVAGWRLITAAQTNPDFFAVQDYAVERGFAVPCGVSDPKREPSRPWWNPIDGSEMIWIPPGKCRLGTDNEIVDVPGFSLAKYAVTNEQFMEFCAETSYAERVHASTDTDGIDRGDYENGPFIAHFTVLGPPPGQEQRPVVYVSYLDALAYCEWAGLSVPGEYQWEKAARGTDGRKFPWGDTVSFTRRTRVANYGSAAPVAVSDLDGVRSPYGCVQMVGNVSAWCQPGSAKDWGEVPPARPKAVTPTSRKPVSAVTRGGAFKRIGPESLAATRGSRLSVLRRNDWVGIRPACFLPIRPADV